MRTAVPNRTGRMNNELCRKPKSRRDSSAIYKQAEEILRRRNGLDMKLLQFCTKRIFGALSNGFFGSFRPLGRQKLSRVFSNN